MYYVGGGWYNTHCTHFLPFIPGRLRETFPHIHIHIYRYTNLHNITNYIIYYKIIENSRIPFSKSVCFLYMGKKS